MDWIIPEESVKVSFVTFVVKDLFSPSKRHLGSSVNLCPPPPDADKQEAPVVKELRRFTLKGVPHKLKQPSKREQRKCEPPEAMTEKSRCENGKRDQNGGDSVRMAEAVYRMLMASLILCDPPVSALFTRHTAQNDTRL